MAFLSVLKQKRVRERETKATLFLYCGRQIDFNHDTQKMSMNDDDVARRLAAKSRFPIEV